MLQFWWWVISCCVVIVVLMWLLHFVCTAKKSSVHWLKFCGLNVYQGHKSIEEYGNSALLKHSVYKWIDNFKSGSKGVMTRWLCTSTTDENNEQVCAKILNHRRVTIDEVAKHLQLSCGCTLEIIWLDFHKICARCIHKQLTEEYKCKCLDICP